MILNDAQTEVRYQSEWFGTFSLRDTIELMATTTLNHLLSHETFQKRLDEGTALSFHELLYPLLQGYDSAMVKSDVELGGIDQKFNVLMGRVVQRSLSMPEQDVVLLKYLPGTDGNAKMSKTLNNTINLTDSADTMFGKIMSIPDSLIIPYFELATGLDEASISSWAEQLKSGQIHPKEAKIKLAKQLVGDYYSPEMATEAANSFDNIFRLKQTPQDMETLTLPPQEYDLVELLTTRTTLVMSKSEARRLISQGGVRKNQTVVTKTDELVSPKDGDEVVIQVGPRRWLKIEWQK
jgi:tyrosyl-tRNA synthetase